MNIFKYRYKRLLSLKGMIVSFLFLFLFCILCFLAPWISPYDYSAQDLGAVYQAPSSIHYLGTDGLGRDILSRLLFGGRISLMIGLVATVVSVIIGTIYGMVAGYLGGWWDKIMMRVVDIVSALPYVMLVIVLMAFLGRGIGTLLVAIGIVEWLTTARIVRSLVMKIKNMLFVQASYALGQSPFNIILKHYLPNIMGVVIVCATITVPGVILLEAMLSFLGLGVQPPMPSLGDMIAEGVRSMEEYPWLLIFPSIAFSGLLLCIHYCGDRLRDYLDVD